MPENKREILKRYFEKGDRPTQKEFYEFIDSGINKPDDQIFVSGQLGTNTQIGIGNVPITDHDDYQPEIKLHVFGRIRAQGLKIYEQDVEGKVLVADQYGNTVWTHPNELDDGDWMVDKPNKLMYSHDPAWNVGIGTSTPQEKLTVNGLVLAKSHDKGWLGFAVINQKDQAWATSGLTLRNENNGHNEWDLSLVLDNKVGYPNRKGVLVIKRQNGSDSINYLHIDEATNSIRFNTEFPGKTPGNFIFQNGKVGIRKNPSHVLDVEGDARMTGFILQNGSQQANRVLISDNSGKGTWIDQTSLNDGDWKVNGNDMYSMPGGKVGIGTSAPTEKLEVQGNVLIKKSGAFTGITIENDNYGDWAKSYLSIGNSKSVNRKFEFLSMLDNQAPRKSTLHFNRVDEQANAFEYLVFTEQGNHISFFPIQTSSTGPNGNLTIHHANVGIGRSRWNNIDQKLQVNGNIGLENGNFLVSTSGGWKKPILIKRFPLSQAGDSSHMDNEWYVKTGKFTDEFGAAAVAGFFVEEWNYGDGWGNGGKEQRDSWVRMILVWNNDVGKSEWVAIANWGNEKNANNDPEENGWTVDVVFYRKQFATFEGVESRNYI